MKKRQLFLLPILMAVIIFSKEVKPNRRLRLRTMMSITRINKRVREVCQALGFNRITTYAARHTFLNPEEKYMI